MAGKVDQLCADVVQDVDGALGCAVVDLKNGLILGVHHNVPYFTQSYLDTVAAAAVDMFRGRGISNVESMLTDQRGEDVSQAIMEIQMTSPRTLHFMMVIPKKPNILLVLITDTKANLGSGWAAIRNASEAVAPLVK